MASAAATQIEPGTYGHPVPFKKRYGNFIGGEWVAPALRPILRKRLARHRQGLLRGPALQRRRYRTRPRRRARRQEGLGQDPRRRTAPASSSRSPSASTTILSYSPPPKPGTTASPSARQSTPTSRSALDHFRYFAGCIRAQEGGISEIDADTVAYHYHEPLGVVGQIIPWNFPLLMAAGSSPLPSPPATASSSSPPSRPPSPSSS